MGTSKLSMAYRGTTVIGSVVSRVLASAVDDLVVVTGIHASDVESVLPDGVAIVRNPDPGQGTISSLRTGVHALAPTDGVVVLLGDMPDVSTSVIDELIACFSAGKYDAVVPHYADGPGHPLLVSTGLIDSVGPVAGDRLLWRAIADLDASARAEIAVSEARPVDVNDPSDYRDAISGELP
jgi:molybdenum cofactor cytidylyltransferase